MPAPGPKSTTTSSMPGPAPIDESDRDVIAAVAVEVADRKALRAEWMNLQRRGRVIHECGDAVIGVAQNEFEAAHAIQLTDCRMTTDSERERSCGGLPRNCDERPLDTIHRLGKSL